MLAGRARECISIYFSLKVVSLDEDTSEFTAKSTFDHPYPTTKIMWIPDSKGIYPGKRERAPSVDT